MDPIVKEYMPQDEIEAQIIQVCHEICLTLIQKGRDYGQAVFNPLSIFANGSPKELIGLYMDSKLKRLKQKDRKYYKEDTMMDFLGYGVLWTVADRLENIASNVTPKN